MALETYGLKVPAGTTQFEVERAAIRLGGKWKNSKGEDRGMGRAFHFKRFSEIVWPWAWYTKWDDLILDAYCDNTFLGIMGPASASKTFGVARIGMTEYICNPDNTAISMSTSTVELLDGRVWADIRRLWEEALDTIGKKLIPGALIEHRRMIITESTDKDGGTRRDFRKGIRGVAVEEKKGIRNFIGVKQERVILFADEAQQTDRTMLDAVSNVRVTPKFFKFVAMGNPKEKEDMLGVICEPVGGWDEVDRTEVTKGWRCRWRGAYCVNLVGTDGPNKGFPKGEEPYPPLIKDWQIEEEREHHGEKSLFFYMFSLGMMPVGELATRIITLSLCKAGKAFDFPNFHGRKVTKVAGLDCATGVSGGDRTIFVEVWFGPETGTEKDIIAIIDGYQKVPIDPKSGVDAEYQIAEWCKQYCTTAGIAPEHLFYDATGRGSLGSAFARTWGVCSPVEFGGLATDRIVSAGDNRLCHEAYGNFVTELWFNSRTVIEGGQLKGLTREMMDDGATRDFIAVDKRKVVVRPKKDMKEDLLKSPDIWDAVVTALEGCRRLGFRALGVPRKHSTPDGKPWWSKEREKYRNSWQSQELVPEAN